MILSITVIVAAVLVGILFSRWVARKNRIEEQSDEYDSHAWQALVEKICKR